MIETAQEISPSDAFDDRLPDGAPSAHDYLFQLKGRIEPNGRTNGGLKEPLPLHRFLRLFLYVLHM
jgi:hypothetical protein